jgi:NAD+ kinase
MLITPLCPHTLSFRPMLLPDNMELRICVPFNSRSTAWASFDGRGRVELQQGDHIKVTASKFPFPTVCADRSSTDWFSSISRTLKWNERERQKSFVVVEESLAAGGAAAEDGGFDIDVIEDDDASAPASSAASSSSMSSVEDNSPGVRAARATMLQPDERALGREKTREDEAHAPHSARHVAFANGERGRGGGGESQRTPTLSSRGSPRIVRSRSAEARQYHPRAFAAWGQDESESENTASDEDR